MLTSNSKPTELVFSIFHHKILSLQAECHFLILWKIPFSVQNILLEKCHAVQPGFHCCVVPGVWYQTGVSDDWCLLSPVRCTRWGLDSMLSYREQAQSSSSHNCSVYEVSASRSTTYFNSCRNIIIFMPLFCSHIHLELANLLQRWQTGDSRIKSGKKGRQISLKCSPACTSPSCCWTAQRLLHACSGVSKALTVQLPVWSITAALLWLVPACQMLISCQQLCTAGERER